MNRRLQHAASQFLQKLAHSIGFLTGLVLVIETGGCASGRSSRLLVEQPVARVPDRDWNQETRLKLVTYNIWGLPSWMTGARSGRYPKIARELEQLNPDVILLQEAWTAKARKSAPRNGVWSIARAAGQHTFFQQSGLVTLSRFPIIDGRFYPFSRAAFPDRFVNKGVLKVTVRLPNAQVLNIWNVHLQDSGSPEIRLSQIRELVLKVQQAEDGQIADLVGGDFNCTPGSSQFRELANSLGPSVQQLGGDAPFVTWDGLSAKPGVGQTLDYIFVRGLRSFENLQAAPRVAFEAANPDQRLSDHLGIEAVLNWSPSPRWAQAIRPANENSQLQAVAARRAVYSGGE